MFFVAGITGHIGGSAASALLEKGERVRALVRDPAKAKNWASRGVELLQGDLTQPETLASALEGVNAAFLMQPTPMGVTREFREAHALTNGIVSALKQNSPPRAVVLSSVGSERSNGLGNIMQTHILEAALARFSFPMATVRPGSLLENYVHSLERVRETSTLESFLQPIDRTFPMAATKDVGDEVARLLIEGWSGWPIVEVGSYYAPADIANAMSQALHRQVEVKAIPRDVWSEALRHMRLTPEQAVNWEEMHDGFNSGWIDFGAPGTRRVIGSTAPVEIFTAAAHSAEGRTR